MSYGRYVEVELAFNVLAKVKTKYSSMRIVSFTSKITCTKHEMYDDYEYGSLDVSEYDYSDSDIKEPIYRDDFLIINSNGEAHANKNDEIIEVLEVFSFDLKNEKVVG